MHDLTRWSMCALALGALAAPAIAADHNESTGVKADGPADIDDVYAWHTADGKVVAIVTFAGQGGDPVGPPDPYDANLLFTISVDNNGDYVSDIDVYARFGQDDMGMWGVQFEGIPGGTGTVSGAVDTLIDAGNGLKAQAGVFDDPFFFDLTGLNDTLATAAVSFLSTRDSFAGKNVNAIVVEMSTASVQATGPLHIWATTGRK